MAVAEIFMREATLTDDFPHAKLVAFVLGIWNTGVGINNQLTPDFPPPSCPTMLLFALSWVCPRLVVLNGSKSAQLF